MTAVTVLVGSTVSRVEQEHRTSAPAATPSPSGRSASPLAPAMPESTLLAWTPAAVAQVAAVVDPDPDPVEVQLAVGPPPHRRSTAVARTGSAATSARPVSVRSAGRAKSSKLTCDDTGLPGSPNTGTAPSVANASGLAGLIATCAHSDSAARAAPATRLEHELHEVVVADRHRAARQQRVARVGGVLDRAR